MNTLITRLALYQLQHKNQIVDAHAPEKNKNSEDIICTCKVEWWTIIMLSIHMLGVTTFLKMNAKKLEYVRGTYTPTLPIWCYLC